jgi:hypothetical protein
MLIVSVAPLEERGGGPPLLDAPSATVMKRSAARSSLQCSSARGRMEAVGARIWREGGGGSDGGRVGREREEVDGGEELGGLKSLTRGSVRA